MATRAAKVTIDETGAGLVVWEGLLDGDDGAGVALARYADKSVQAVGDFVTAGAIALQGSNDGGTTWGAINDPQGSPISLTNSDMVLISESPLLIRPLENAGTSVDIDVYIAFVVKGK